MRHRNFISVLAALVLCIPLSGCDLLSLPDDAETENSVSDHKDQRFDTASLKAKAEECRKVWNDSGQSELIQTRIDEFLDAVDEAYAIQMRAQIEYYSDWNNDDLFALSNETTEDYCIADEIAAWFFANGYQSSSYPELFEPYADSENLSYYTLNNLTRVIAYARSDASSHSGLIQDYYDIAYDDDIDPDETNKRCAKIYLDLLKDYDVSEALFDYYLRDYTAKEASAIYQTVLEKFVPLRDALKEQIGTDDIWNRQCNIDPYAELKKYAPRLGENISESVTKLVSDRLYTEARGNNCYDGSFTVNLPGEQSALIYTYLSDVFYDFITVTHEFGHFHCDWRDVTPVYLQSMNFDIAEAQSQSMVTLFLPYYTDIFGEDGALYRRTVLYDLLDSLIAGFAVGEFEYEVTQQLDDLKPAEAAALFAEIMEQSGVDMELYQVTHLYEQPGYYISYGISALPALEMYDMVGKDYRNALGIYDQLSSCSCMNAQYTFKEVMAECGFPDFFDDETLNQLADSLSEQIGIGTAE